MLNRFGDGGIPFPVVEQHKTLPGFVDALVKRGGTLF